MGKWRREILGEVKEPLNEYLKGLVSIEKEKGNHIKFIIGTDSQKKGKGVQFSTVILLEIKTFWENKNEIIEVGKGGMVLYKNIFKNRSFSLNEKIIKEVQMSVELAYEILPLINKLGCSLELHADINSNPIGKSYSVLNVAVNWLSGPGCKWKIKPEAYAATHTADKYCR